MSSPNNFVISKGSFHSEKFSVSLADYQNEVRQDWHRHDDFVIVMVLAGHVREQVGTQDTLISPLDVGIKAPGTRHTDHFWKKGVRAAKIGLTSVFVEELKKEGLIEDDWKWTREPGAARPFLRVCRFLTGRSQDLSVNKDQVSDEIYDVLAALSTDVPETGRNNAPRWLRVARDRLESSYRSGVRLTDLATGCGIHPVYFARQFRRFFGCSVGDYVRRLQVRAALPLIAKGWSLTDAALHAGFADQAHLTRVLSSELGISPGRYRKLVRF